MTDPSTLISAAEAIDRLAGQFAEPDAPGPFQASALRAGAIAARELILGMAEGASEAFAELAVAAEPESDPGPSAEAMAALHAAAARLEAHGLRVSAELVRDMIRDHVAPDATEWGSA